MTREISNLFMHTPFPRQPKETFRDLLPTQALPPAPQLNHTVLAPSTPQPLAPAGEPHTPPGMTGPPSGFSSEGLFTRTSHCPRTLLISLIALNQG